MTAKTVLVLGIGNLLLSDEGIGVHVVRRLQESPVPPHVELIDGGTAGIELIEFFRGKTKVVVVDAVRAEAEPGTVFRFTLEDVPPQLHSHSSAHQNDLWEVLHFSREMVPPSQVVVFGIVPQEIEHLGMELTPPVRCRMDFIVSAILEEVEQTGSGLFPFQSASRQPSGSL